MHDVSLGLIYDFRNPSRADWKTRYDATLEQIAWIDSTLPFDGIRVTEHHFYEDGYMPSPLLMLAAVAVKTERVTIGTNLLQLPLHHPVRVSEESLVLDALSGGRMELGVGAGYHPQEFGGLGADLGTRPSTMKEALEVLRLAFDGATFSYEGKRFRIPEVEVTPIPVRPGGPGLWMGAFAPAAIERAATYADGFLAFTATGITEYFEACDKVGRPVEEQRANQTYWAIIAEDPERAFAKCGPHWLYQLNEYIVRGGVPNATVPYESADKALADGLILLTDGDGAVATFNEAIGKGAIDINIIPVMPGEPLDEAAERIEYIAAHVIPRLDKSTHPAAASNKLRRPLPTTN